MTRDGGYRLGIDFGTSNSVAVLAGSDGRVRPLLFDGSPVLVSAVFAAPGSGLLVGVDAVRAALGCPAGLEPNPKRRIDDGMVWLGEREYPVVDLVAAVLGRVGAEASRVAGGPVDEVVLTHPVTWGRPRLAILADAAVQAALGQVRFVAEPVAAAAYFAAVLGREIPAGRCIVVYDLGGGTFDVSVVRPGPDGFEVVASAGLSDVGGLDLDAAVVRHARAGTAGAGGAWQRLDWPRSPADQHARHTLWQAARAVKEQLSRHPTGELYVPLVDGQVHITRDEFEKAARPHLDRTTALTVRVLAEAGIPPEDVGGVFLVGGSSRIPLAATLLHRTLRIAPTVIDHPELVVAEGALHAGAGTAWQAAGPTDVADPATAHAGGVTSAGGTATDGGPVDSAQPAQSTGVTSWEPASPATRNPPGDGLAVAGRPGPRVGVLTAVLAVVVVCVVVAAAGILVALRPWQSSPIRGAQRLGEPLTGHTDWVNGVAFSPDGTTLATVSSDGTTRLWNVDDRTPTGGPLTGRPGFLYTVAFSRDGNTLVTGGDQVRLWNVDRREPVGEPLAGHTGYVHGLAFHPDGATIAVAGDTTVQLWDWRSRERVGDRLAGHAGDVRGLAFDRAGRTLATVSTDRTVRLWDVNRREPIGGPLTAHTGVVHEVAFSPDGKTLATVSSDRTVRLWDVDDRTPIGDPLTGHTGVVYGVAFSPDGKTLATASEDRTVRLWDVGRRKPIGDPLTGHTSWVRAVAFSPNGKILATTSDDKTSQLWQLIS